MRLHEVAKVVGVAVKVLMSDLEKVGFKYSTHMAVVEDKAMAWLIGKYPKLKDKPVIEAGAALEAKTRKTKPKASKVVTQRNLGKKTEKKTSEVDPVDPSQVELLKRQEGSQGETVTLEQRVVGSGIIRRRRVENPVEPVLPTPEPVVEAVVVAEPEELVTADVVEPIFEENLDTVDAAAARADEAAEVAVTFEEPEHVFEPKKDREPEVVAPVVSEPITPPVIVQTPAVAPAPAPRPAGRNLSAAPRLKIVEQPVYSRPPTEILKSSMEAKKAKAKAAETPAPAADDASKDKLAAKKKAVAPVKAAEPSVKLTKKDLLGMMEEVEITRPLARKPKKHAVRIERKSPTLSTPGVSKRKIRIDTDISVAELADRLGVKAAELIRKLITMGQMVTVQQRLDLDTATLVAGEYGYEVQNVTESAEQIFEGVDAENSGSVEGRPPIVTVMGHVDHGKTSLLDAIRKTRVASGEAGGITQHIGAYQIEHNGKKITFIDTPGHAAFTSMRARGASVTDLVILVVAADEGVKPQTLEALAHAKAAKVPIIVAVNKIDKPEANADRVTQELSGHNLVPEAWGGDTMYVKVSALAGTGLPDLLEAVLLQAEVLDLKADSKKLAKGIVIESRLDKGKGPVASVIIQNGTLEVGQFVVCGIASGKVRAMLNERGAMVKTAGPSTPVEFLGLDSVPNAGDVIRAVAEDALAKRAQELNLIAKQREDQKSNRMALEDMFKKMQQGEISELRIVLKGDVQGSVEAIHDSLVKIKHDKVKVNIIYKAVGAISESDIDLAAASGAIVIGFNVRPTSQAKDLAQRTNVQIKTHEIIYELIDEVKKAMQGLLAPIVKEQVLGHAEVREVFTISKVGPVAGSFVKSGKIVRNAHARLIRDNVVIYTTKVQSVRRFKDDAREVVEGFECGIRLENFTDMKAGDIIECFENIEIAQAVG